jgi:hypothetical protein
VEFEDDLTRHSISKVVLTVLRFPVPALPTSGPCRAKAITSLPLSPSYCLLDPVQFHSSLKPASLACRVCHYRMLGGKDLMLLKRTA